MYDTLDSQWRQIGLAGLIELIIVAAIVMLVVWFYNRYERTTLLREANRRLSQEVDERRRAEGALRESEERFRRFIGNSPTAAFLKDLDGRITFANPKFTEWYGLHPEEAVGKTSHDIFPKAFADSFVAQDARVTASGTTFEGDHDVPFADGSIHTVVVTKFPVFGPDGSAIGIGTINTDVTEQRRTEQALRRSQRLEAVGQLTGGIAHDFNNLLAIVRGNAELLRDQIGDNPLLTTIDRATMRGAELTQRLLSFARQQALHPQAIDLTKLIPAVQDLLQRAIGDPIDIVATAPAGTWPVLADPGQLENALLNLTINARDAMPDGGRIEISCANVTRGAGGGLTGAEMDPGDYVCITVRDTGTGMAPEVVERAFEPFFTTKDVGQGSGLGLSMVYGFARQSDGGVEIDSKPGAGTEIRLYLARTEATNGDVPAAPQPEELPRGQGETILVLEDEPDVRGFAVDCLTALGYRVLEAGDAAAAQAIFADDQPIDLLLSDVLLPGGLSGPALAATVKATRPDLKIVFMTGYAPNHDARLAIGDIGEVLLNKPFRRAELARTVWESLRG